LKDSDLKHPAMPPITKIWHCRLKAGHTVHPPSFIEVLTNILELCASYTNPDQQASQPPMHVMYQNTSDPSQLVMITGYPSQELNTEADRQYAAKFLPKMFEHVQHVWLKQLDADITTFPLAGESVITLAYGREPEGWKKDGSSGGWDVFAQSEQARKNRDNVVGLSETVATAGVDWVQVTPGSDESPAPKDGGKFTLQKIQAS
jgi:hypothetical protein